jgi:hypothetical protein
MSTEPRVAERPHARPFSPSSADIAFNCLKSVEFELEGARRAPGASACNGTAQHEAFAICWHRQLEAAEIPAVWVDGRRVPLTPQNHQAIDCALAWCRPRFLGREVVIEKLLRSPWGGLFGYADLATLDEPLAIVDLKFGYAPIAPTSVQVGLYALMLALEVRRSIEGDGGIETTILQPRNPDPVRTHTWTNEELRGLRSKLLGVLGRIRRRDFTYEVGSWCRWCPAVGVCPALHATAIDAAAATLAPPQVVASGELSAEHLDQMLELAPALERLSRRLPVLAREYLLAGGRLQTRKLVKKRGGGVTVVDRSDPRPEIDGPAVLESARQALTAAQMRPR